MAVDNEYTQICRQPHDTDGSLLPVLELPLRYVFKENNLNLSFILTKSDPVLWNQSVNTTLYPPVGPQ